MKILHLFSDWKWTGPSEPILNLCYGLIKSGTIVHLACLAPSERPVVNVIATSDKSKHPGVLSNGLRSSTSLQPLQALAPSRHTLPDKAKELGIKILLLSSLHVRAIHEFSLQLLSVSQNIRKLVRYINSEQGFDIIHCHSSMDHFYAYLLRRHFTRLWRAGKDIKIVRTNHKGFPLELSYSNRFLLKYATDGYIALSKSLTDIDRKGILQYAPTLTPESVAAIGGAVDIKPQIIQIKSKDNLRTGFGIKEGDIVIGVVARVQRHRRFNIIIEAMRLVVKEMPSVKLLIIGRGTHYDELVTRLVKELNLGDNVISAGYRKDDYFDIINILDFGVYLVPGSDGSCRAALELMAAGKPLIVARRGVLPEIVDNNQSGLVIDDTAENLAQAILHLAKDKELLNRFSQEARLKMTREFSRELSVKATTDFYHKVLKKINHKGTKR